MYSLYPTAADRRTIAQAADPAFTYVSRARRLLMRVLAEHFEYAEQKPIDRSDAEDMADILHSVNDALWEAEREYFSAVGQYWAVPGDEYFYRDAQRALLVRDVEQLRSRLDPKDTAPYVNMADEDALPILREIAEKKGVAV